MSVYPNNEFITYCIVLREIREMLEADLIPRSPSITVSRRVILNPRLWATEQLVGAPFYTPVVLPVEELIELLRAFVRIVKKLNQAKEGKQ